MGIATRQPPENSDAISPARDSLSPKAPLPRRLCAVAEAARYLSLSTWTIREMVWRGDLPHVRQGRRILLDLRDLDAWVDRAKARGT